MACLVLTCLLAACATPPPPPPPPKPPAPPPLAGASCLADLRRHNVSFEITSQPTAGIPCVIASPVRVISLGPRLGTPALMSCGLADRLAHFTEDSIQPLAHQILGQGVTVINHYGAFACRDEIGGRPNHLSQHALGQAIDIEGVTLADGSRITVRKDWADPGPHGRFLHLLAKAACRQFSVVLTPASNAHHANHFHLDIGPDHYCGGS